MKTYVAKMHVTTWEKVSVIVSVPDDVHDDDIPNLIEQAYIGFEDESELQDTFEGNCNTDIEVIKYEPCSVTTFRELEELEKQKVQPDTK